MYIIYPYCNFFIRVKQYSSCGLNRWGRCITVRYIEESGVSESLSDEREYVTRTLFHKQEVFRREGERGMRERESPLTHTTGEREIF